MFFGCTTSPQNRRWYVAELSSSSGPSVSSEVSVSLPSAARVNPKTLRPLTMMRIFRSRLPRRLEDLDASTAPQDHNLTLVANCDSEILKAFVSRGWAQPILLKYGNQSHPWIVVGYGLSGNIHLKDPRDSTQKARTVTNFQREWKLPSPGQCALITAEQLNKPSVKRTLQKYLPPTKVSQVHILRETTHRTASVRYNEVLHLSNPRLK